RSATRPNVCYFARGAPPARPPLFPYTTLGGSPAHGTLTFNPDGTYTYTPDADYNGSDSFTYQAVDSLGGISNTATVSITVTSVSNPPQATNVPSPAAHDGVLNVTDEHANHLAV